MFYEFIVLETGRDNWRHSYSEAVREGDKHTASGRGHLQLTDTGLQKHRHYQTSMKTITAMTISMMLLQALGAPQSKPVKKIDTIRNPSDLSYEELNYIDQMRRGRIAEPPKRLSPCAKAILGCCQEKLIDSECSEALQCGAHFFDDNPCDDKFIVDALNAARHYYDQFNKVNT